MYPFSPDSAPIQAPTWHWAESPCHAVGPCWLSLLNIAVGTYLSQTPYCPFPSPTPLAPAGSFSKSESVSWGFPGGTSGKESTCNTRDTGSIPGLGRSPGGGHGSLLHYSCLQNPMDRGAWQAIVHRVANSQTWKVSEHTHTLSSWVILLGSSQVPSYTGWSQ